MYTSTLVKEPKPGCMAQLSVLHDVQHSSSVHELTSSAPILTLQEEFRSMSTPPEFVSLGLLDCQAPDSVGGRVSYSLDNWKVITQDPWVLSVVKEGYQIEWVSKPCQMVPPFQPTFSPEMNSLVDTEVQEMILKGAIMEVAPTPGQYVSTIFLVNKKDGGMRPVINLKHLNHLVRYEHFQMEGLGSLLNSLVVKDYLTKLYLKDAYFTLPIHQRDQKYLRFRWRGKLYQFLVLPFGLSSAPRVFTRVMKAPMFLLEMPSIQECRLLGRHLSRQPARSGSSKDPGNSMAVITSGVHHKLEEILRTSISERGVSGVHCGFSEPIGNPSSDEGGQDNFHMYGSARTQGLRVANSSVFDWQVAECLDGNSSGTASFPIDADGKHQGFGQGAAKLCCPSGIARRSIVGAEVVGSKSLDLERKVFSEPRPRAGYCNHFRCQSLGLGCRVPRPDNPGTVVSDGDVTAHQCTGTEGSRASSKVFQGPLGGQPCSVTTGQYNCSIPDSENGVTSVKKVFGGDQRDMGICIVAREHDYCSAYSRQTEHHRRLPESDFQGQQQLEAVSAGISKSAEDVSLDRGRSVCRSFEPSSSKILELETRSTSRGRRRTDSGLEGDEGIRLSTLQVNSQSVKESSERESDFTPYRSCVASTGLVPDVVEDADRAASADTSVTTSPHCSRWVSTSHVSEPEAGPSGLAGIRGPVKGPELSADARDLVAKARSSGTIRAYKSGWQKFYRWCGQRQVNPFSCPVELVVNFLAEQQRFVLFGTLAGYRSAISHFHVKVDGVPVGKHPLVVEVMKGSFRDNPPVPRYTHTWDINIVLTYLQEMGPNAGLSQKELTLKLAMLLALVCRARGHELHAINPQAISWFEDKAVCHILGMTKTKTQSKPHKSFEIMRYKVSNNIDPVQCLQSYLHLTASQRESGEQKSHLFLSFASPHHAIKTCTIARWLKIVMADAGVDLSKFKAHSTRAAAVSKVPLSGLSVMEIAKLGDWSNATTFYKFCKKEIQVPSSESAVQGSILSLS